MVSKVKAAELGISKINAKQRKEITVEKRGLKGEFHLIAQLMLATVIV
jgi:hypothetical protein